MSAEGKQLRTIFTQEHPWEVV